MSKLREVLQRILGIAAILSLLLFAYQLDGWASIDYPLKPWDQWTVYKDSNFGDYRKSDSAYHSGIDLTLKDSINDGVNKPVYAIADGQVFKVDKRELGWSVVLKHTSTDQQFVIPEHNSQEYQYKQEKVSTIYSVYIHIQPIDKIKKKTAPNDITVKKGEIIGYINEMPPGKVPHLHFEIRHPNANQSSGGSMLYPEGNWSSKGDYLNMQTLVESGARNPLEFLEANVQEHTFTPLEESVESEENFFPLLEGTCWIYKVVVKKGSKITEGIVTHEIIETIDFGDTTVAVMKTQLDPPDLDESSDNSSMIIRIGSKKFYGRDSQPRISLDGNIYMPELLYTLSNSKNPHIDGYVGDIMLDLPLAPGKRFDDDSEILVELKDQVELKNIKGIPSSGKMTRYRLKLDNAAMSNISSIADYVPGIGLIRSEWKSFLDQTLIEHQIQTLIEYRKGHISAIPNDLKIWSYKVPIVTNVDPVMVSPAGGTEITITGIGFNINPAPSVTIGGIAAINVKAVSDTSLKVIVPPGVTGEADITVQNVKTNVKSRPFTFKGLVYYDMSIPSDQKPTITGVYPNMGSIAGGTEITITGTGFATIPSPIVTVGRANATGVKVISKTSLKAVTPAGATGEADIVVRNARAKVSSVAYKGFKYFGEDVTAIMTVPDMATAPPEGVEAPAKVSIIFNQEVDPATVAIKVTDATAAEVAGTVASDAAGLNMFSFTPKYPLKAGNYTVAVSGAVGKAAGNTMAGISFTFKVKEIKSIDTKYKR